VKLLLNGGVLRERIVMTFRCIGAVVVETSAARAPPSCLPRGYAKADARGPLIMIGIGEYISRHNRVRHQASCHPG